MPNALPSLDTVVCEAIEIADADARAKFVAHACAPDGRPGRSGRGAGRRPFPGWQFFGAIADRPR